jgi:hypothetical protein
MYRNLNQLFAGLAVLVILGGGQLPARAQDQHPVLMASGFQFDQIDAICVRPPIDARDSMQHIDLSGLRPALMVKVQERGYRLLDPSCSGDSGANTTQAAKSRWILTVKLDSFEVSKGAPNVGLGSYLTASLFDNQTAKEVWRDTSKTGYGGRFASALLGSSIDSLVESGFGAVLDKFEKPKKPNPPSPATMWQPISFASRLYKKGGFTECNGQLSFDSGTLSFAPSSNGKSDGKCESFRFSVQGARFGAAMWLIVPGKGRYFLQQSDASKLGYLDVALRNML